MHSSRMRTVRLLTVSVVLGAVCIWGEGWADPSGCRPPFLLDAEPPGHVTCDACREANYPSPVDRMRGTCKNITLPQTLFAGGKY